MSKFSLFDHQCMSLALQLAEQGRYTTHPNPRVGCVIAKDQQIIGQGFHEKAGLPHAEINALKDANQKGHSVIGATVYVTLEPCSHTGKTPPCADALVQLGAAKVIIAMTDPNPLVSGRGVQRLRDAGIVVEIGLLESSAKQLNLGFIKRMEHGLPWVSIKMAMSLDGRTAMASGESKWITGEAARKDVQLLRAQSDAILTGIGTVLADDPSMNVRLSASELGINRVVRQPMRVILDRRLQMPISAAMLKLSGKTLILTQSTAKWAYQGDDDVECVQTADMNDLEQILRYLASRQINHVHVEAGSKLSGALVQAGLVDELIIYMAGHLIGSDARPLFDLPIASMKERIALKIHDIRAIGDDWRIIAKPQLV